MSSNCQLIRMRCKSCMQPLFIHYETTIQWAGASHVRIMSNLCLKKRVKKLCRGREVAPGGKENYRYWTPLEGRGTMATGRPWRVGERWLLVAPGGKGNHGNCCPWREGKLLLLVPPGGKGNHGYWSPLEGRGTMATEL